MAKVYDIKDANGNKLSPVLAATVKNFLIDIDGTVCEDVPNEEPDRMSTVIPYDGAVQYVNQLFEEGHVITFFTSRTQNLSSITEDWLNQWGFKYHSVLYGKPRGGNYHWIDNHVVKSTLFKGKFSSFVKKNIESDEFED